jgi:putative ATP-dependent endonuclease of OLD family
VALVKKVFSPNLTWILFEEPEAFLHPSQIDILNSSMAKIVSGDENQITITTHNPQFVSKNIEDLPSLVRLCKIGTHSAIKQVSHSTLGTILATNQQDLAKWQAAGIQIDPVDLQVDMESIKYALWLNPHRCCAFFANKILLVEGATEVAILGCLFGEGKILNPSGGVFVFDTIGKYNIHRFMNLFGEFGIPHAVLFDRDDGKQTGVAVEATIQACKNQYTIDIDYFDKDLETYLGIPTTKRSNCKPQHVMWYYRQGKIEQKRVNDLAAKVQKLLKI